MSSRIDVSIEHRDGPTPDPGAKPHPNTCPSCGSHYRDDELERHLFVCPHCGAAMIIVEIFTRGATIRAPPAERAAA